MAAAEPELLDRLREAGVFAGLAGVGGVVRAQRITGHASTRRFVRLWLERPAVTRILVVYPKESAREVDRYRDTNAWLRFAGVNVPHIHARGDRSLLLQDAGDALLDTVSLDADQRLRYYRQAADVIARVQRHGGQGPLPNGDWCLDYERLRAELEFAEEHAIRGWLGHRGDGPRRRDWYDRVANAAASLPMAACHRDFHARNLLLGDERLVVVDFQDLMAGPLLYDAASLVWDNYCDLDRRTTATTLAAFWRQCRRQLAPSSAARVPVTPPGLPAAARQAFCFVGLQRSLKALGTFGYQVTVAGNAEFARYVPRTWAHVTRAARALGWDGLLEVMPRFGDPVA